MAKEGIDVNSLPTLDDFTEVGLLSKQKIEQNNSITKTQAEIDSERKAQEDKNKLEVENKAKQDQLDKAKQDQAKLEEDKKKQELAGKTDIILDANQEAALVKKAEETPETLTEEERNYLVSKGLFEDSGSFWEDVERIHGIQVEVDYKNTDPESPEGAALRDQALFIQAQKEQLKYLADTYPKAYQVLEHIANGGQLEDLVNSDQVDFSKVVLNKDDKDAQKALLTDYYLAKGFDQKRATRMVEADEDSKEGLLEVANAALKELQKEQEETQKVVLAEAKQRKAAQEQRNVQFKSAIKQVTDAGKLGDFTILNKADREAFYQHVIKNVYSDGKDGYQLVLPVNDKSLIPVLQQLFFGFKDGKLEEFVRKEAQTQVVRKLQRKVSQTVVKPGTQEAEAQAKANQAKTLPTFDVFTVK